MGQKIITQLQLRDNFGDTVNLAGDDTIQTYRVTGAQIRSFLNPLAQDQIGYIKNAGLNISASAGAITVGLRQKNGTAALSTGINATEIAFRSQTITSTAVNIVAFDSTTNIVIPSGATLGYSNGQNAEVFIYAFSNGTDKGLAVCSRRLDESRLWSTIEIDADSDNQDLYANSAFANCAIRLIGRLVCNAISTAGTWVTPNNVSSAGVQKDPMPVGAVLPYAASSAPSGYLLCHGQAVSRTRYAELFAVIGITHGQGDGSTTFRLPDYRGRFLRGLDNGAGRDSYRTSRTAMNTGGNSGDNVGAVNESYYTGRSTMVGMNAGSAGAHTHIFESDASTVSPVYTSGSGTIVGTNNALGRRSAAGSKYTVSGAVLENGAHTHSISGGGDLETAPKSANVEYIIKI